MDPTMPAGKLAAIVPVHDQVGGCRFVVLAEIPEPWRSRFQKSLDDDIATCPIVEGFGACAFAWDWELWAARAATRRPASAAESGISGAEEKAAVLGELLNLVPVHEKESAPRFVVLDEIPTPWRDRFRKWLVGNDTGYPVIAGYQHDACALAFNWRLWVEQTCRAGDASECTG